MSPSILCPRHGHTASILACEHICAAVSLGTGLPAYRHMGVTVDNASTVAYCACFACAKQFELASESRAFANVEAGECKFPKSDPTCAACLEQTRSSAAADLAAMRSESANSRAQSPVRPIQVTAAVLLLCVAVGQCQHSPGSIGGYLSPPVRSGSLYTLFLFMASGWASLGCATSTR